MLRDIKKTREFFKTVVRRRQFSNTSFGRDRRAPCGADILVYASKGL